MHFVLRLRDWLPAAHLTGGPSASQVVLTMRLVCFGLLLAAVVCQGDVLTFHDEVGASHEALGTARWLSQPRTTDEADLFLYGLGLSLSL